MIPTIIRYLPSTDKLVKCSKAVSNSETLGKISKCISPFTALTSAYDFITSPFGGAIGGITDFFTGFLDLSQDQYTEEGGAKPGTMAGDLGKMASGGAVAFFNRFSERIQNSLPKSHAKKFMQFLSGGILAYQLASGTTEILNPDDSGIQNFGNVAGEFNQAFKTLRTTLGTF
jgi:hypothetical protein